MDRTQSRPDFLCIGAQKAGSTWLNRALRTVAEIFVPVIKELHYFDSFGGECPNGMCRSLRSGAYKRVSTRILEHKPRTPHDEFKLRQLDHFHAEQIDDEWYRGNFAFAKHGQIKGEVCPAYMSMPMNCIERVIQMNPQIRIVLLLRDPVERAWSQMRMAMRQGRYSYDLERFLNEDIFTPMHSRFDYAGSIPRWRSVVPDDRFLPIVFDRIAAEPNAVIHEVLSFLGVPDAHVGHDLTQRVNLGDDLPLPVELRARFYRELEPQYDAVCAFFPEYVQRWRAHQEQMLAHRVG